MDWLVTPPKLVTSPAWGPPPPCKQAVLALIYDTLESFHGIILLFMYMYLCLGCMWGTPSSPNSDQHQFSPNNIHMLPREMVMRVNNMIT